MKTKWNLFALVCGCVFALGCPQKGAPPTQAESTPKTAVSPSPKTDAIETPCTLETPLVPGVPGSPGHLIPSSINPNGASELADLMRTMQTDLTAAREAILKGASVGPLLSRFRKIRCSWPTSATDRDAAFDARAQSYLAAVQALEQAPPPESKAAYRRVLDGCRSCHEQNCAGALKAIDSLSLPPPTP